MDFLHLVGLLVHGEPGISAIKVQGRMERFVDDDNYLSTRQTI